MNTTAAQFVRAEIDNLRRGPSQNAWARLVAAPTFGATSQRVRPLSGYSGNNRRPTLSLKSRPSSTDGADFFKK
jgi:hypothetical protein